MTKATLRNQRNNCSAKHNDRTNITYDEVKEENNRFYVQRAGRDDFSRMKQNKNGTMELCEIQIYEHEFGSWLKKRNEKELRNRHPDRVMTMEQVYKSDRYRPEETIYQIGASQNGTDLKDVAMFEKILFETLKKEREMFPQVRILSVSIHADESALHAHVRKMYITQKNEPGMEKTLQEMGIERPNPEKKSGKYNNRKITYTKQAREIWYEEIEQNLGITIDRNVKNPSRKRKTKLEYECEVMEARLNELKTALEGLGELDAINRQAEDKLSKIKQIKENIKQELSHRTDDAIRERCACMEQFLNEKNLWQEYQQFLDYLEETELDVEYSE